MPETCFPIRPSNGRGVSKDRHAAYLIKARRANLHPKAGYIDADFLSLNFSLAFTRRTIHLGKFTSPEKRRRELAQNPTFRALRDYFRLVRLSGSDRNFIQADISELARKGAGVSMGRKPRLGRNFGDSRTRIAINLADRTCPRAKTKPGNDEKLNDVADYSSRKPELPGSVFAIASPLVPEVLISTTCFDLTLASGCEICCFLLMSFLRNRWGLDPENGILSSRFTRAI